MGLTAALKLRQVAENFALVLSLELLCAAQGIDFRQKRIGPGKALGRGTAPVYSALRESIPFIERDEYMKPHIDAAAAYVKEFVHEPH